MIEEHKIRWENEIPHSEIFGDIYFSESGGKEESMHVFQTPNRIPERALKGSPTTILELGFGTGLNFFISRDLYRKSGFPGPLLHYIAIEKYPLKLSDMKKIKNIFPDLKIHIEDLIFRYPFPVEGFHRRIFDEGRTILTLIYGDAREYIHQISGKIDACFLDGFSPSKNPGLWDDAIFSGLAKLCKKDTTLSTYSCAGSVRENLRNNGFSAEKTDGFGKKRHMLFAKYKGISIDHAKSRENNHKKYEETGFSSKIETKISESNKNAAIIGAGLAGTFAAYSLSQRGFSITMIDRNDGPAGEASGNPAGLLYPAVTADASNLGRLNITGYLHALNHLKELKINFSEHENGILQVFTTERDKKRILSGMKDLSPHIACQVSSEDSNRLSGLNLSREGIYFPHGKSLNPQELCMNNINLSSASVKTIYNAEIEKIEYQDGLWRTIDGEGSTISETEFLILANSWSIQKFKQTDWIPVTKVRGQISYIKNSKEIPPLKISVCGEGYLTAEIQDKNYSVAGSTYHPDRNDSAVDPDLHAEIIEKLERSGIHFTEENRKNAEGRVSFRCSVLDHLPAVGPVPDLSKFQTEFSGLASGKKMNTEHSDNFDPALYLPGLYIASGFSSRGLVYAPIAGELIASYMNNEVMPVDRDLSTALNPARFILRNLKRGKFV